MAASTFSQVDVCSVGEGVTNKNQVLHPPKQPGFVVRVTPRFATGARGAVMHAVSASASQLSTVAPAPKLARQRLGGEPKGRDGRATGGVGNTPTLPQSRGGGACMTA